MHYNLLKIDLTLVMKDRRSFKSLLKDPFEPVKNRNSLDPSEREGTIFFSKGDLEYDGTEEDPKIHKYEESAYFIGDEDEDIPIKKFRGKSLMHSDDTFS